jgi:hypothetical protein
MGKVVRALALAVALGTGMVGFATMPRAAAQSCDPAYVSHCVPPLEEVGDLNFDYFYEQGIYGIQLADPTWDPHGLDGWNYVDDGIGCEGELEGASADSSAAQGIVAPADAGASTGECDPSYPDLCLTPGLADLDCGYIYGLGMSHITVYPPDPHGFDSDGNGMGCESP